jgi:hypothetical protein
LKAIATPSGNNHTLRWSSGNTNVATIGTTSGIVHPQSQGETLITVWIEAMPSVNTSFTLIV